MSESDISLYSSATGTLDAPAAAPADVKVPGGSAAPRLTNISTILHLIFSFPALLGCALAGVVFYYAGRQFPVDPDIWWHIKVGETILRTHQWPTLDPYSFTVFGQPWIAHEWLGDVLLATAYRLGGIPALDIVLIALGSAIVIALYAFATLCSGKSKAGFVATAILSPITVISFSLRPQMLGYLFLILTLIALEQFRQKKEGMLWMLPFLMIVWVNAHGSWIMGPLAILVYWLAGLIQFHVGSLTAKAWTIDQRQKIGCVFVFCLAAIPINPYGVRIASVPFEVAFSLPITTQYVQEFEPMPFTIFGGKLFLALLLAFILVQVVSKFEWRVEELTLFLFGTLMACLHIRFLLVFVPFFAPVLAKILASWLPQYDQTKDKFALNAVLMGCIAVAVIHYFPSTSGFDRILAHEFPVDAVAYLEHHVVPEPMYNTYGFGGYLVWSRAPQHRVFIDGRSDVYERGGLLSDYLHISRLEPGAIAMLRVYGIRSCILERDEPLSTVLSASPDWQRIYVDDLSAIYVRR